MKRVMCIDDSYTPEIKFGEVYVVNGVEVCNSCKLVYYYLQEVNIPAPIGSTTTRCADCGHVQPIDKPLYSYESYRFIDIDEYAKLTEVEQSQKETV